MTKWEALKLWFICFFVALKKKKFKSVFWVIKNFLKTLFAKNH